MAGAFAAVKAEPQVVTVGRQVHTLISLVEAGVGVAVVPEGVRRLRLDHVRYLRIADAGECRAELYAAFHRDAGPLCEAVVDVLVEALGSKLRKAPEKE